MGNVASVPDLFNAILCQVAACLDMKRYSHLLAGASWMGEYGDPDDPEQWKFLQTFSPTSSCRPTRVQRSCFIPAPATTGSTRATPANGGEDGGPGPRRAVLENTEGGHAGAANNEQRAKMWALSWTFLWSPAAVSVG